MFRKGVQQKAVLTLSVMLLASVPAAAAGGPGPLWADADTGACLDPNGRCLTAVNGGPAASQWADSDQGACIDPNGCSM
jgi:hypothetical protein